MEWIANIDWAGATCFGIFVVVPLVAVIADHLHRKRLLDEGYDDE